MADIAVVFGWPPSEMLDMEIDDLMEWHRQAKERAGVKGLSRG